MLSEKRLEELVGISRAQWEWEQKAEERDAAYAKFMEQAALIEPYQFIPNPAIERKRGEIASALSAAWPYNAWPEKEGGKDTRQIARLCNYLLALWESPIASRPYAKIGIYRDEAGNEYTKLRDPLQKAAAQLFLDSHFDWAAFTVD